MDTPGRVPARARGSQIDPPNRFTRIEFEEDFAHFENDSEFAESLRSLPTEYFHDESRSVISENDSPDIPFRYSLNPYRGCLHGCSYCFARPTHEYFQLSAGRDFESKIFVKERAPELFREWLCRPGWVPEAITISGVTDCYQPAERKFQLTRRCLEVALEARQPVTLITKNALILRDLDLLKEFAQRNLVRAAVSLTTLDQSLARVMEPRTSSPAARLRTIAELSSAGVPTIVMTAPIIPGLTDSEIPALLKAAREHGAVWAGYVLLRLPWSVEPVFREWLERTQPGKKDKIESLLRGMRGGKLYNSQWGSRMRGTGPLAEQIEKTFDVFARRLSLDVKPPPLDCSQFRPPTNSRQKLLFE